MNKILKKSILPVIIMLTEIFLYFQMTLENPEITMKYKLVFISLIALSNIAIFIILNYLNNKDTLKIENLFLVITILFGGLYLIFIPAILGTDELPHFLRPYQISVGDIIVKNPEKNETQIPTDLVEFTRLKNGYISRYSKENIFKSVDYNQTENLWNGDVTSINYSPIPYIPQILGFWLARLLHLSPLLTLFLVRFLNFSSWIILGYFAIKLLPTKKLFALILYTAPAVLSLVSTCSGDAFALGLFFLLISYIFNLIKTKRKLTKKDYLLIFLISTGISTFKIFYVLYLLMLFLIPKESFNNNKKKKYIILSLIIAFALLLDFTWFILTTLSATVGTSGTKEQIYFILSNPLKYIFIFINTYINNLYYYITNFVAGSEMCYGLAKINQLFVLSYLSLLVLTYFDGEESYKISLFQKILIIIICLAIFGLVSTTLYLDWTSKRVGIGSLTILGIQSRYFLPLVLPIILILNYNKKIKNRKLLIKLTSICNLFILLDTIKSLLIYIAK